MPRLPRLWRPPPPANRAIITHRTHTRKQHSSAASPPKIGRHSLLAAVPVAIGASIVVTFAQRAIAVEDLGPVGALGAGLRLLRGHLGESLLAWLIALALGFGAGPAVFVLGGVGVGVWAVAGLSAPTVGYGVLAGLVLLAALLVVVGVANTFLWNYWTLAYLRLTGQAAAG
jgi:hypothetical protein